MVQLVQEAENTLQQTGSVGIGIPGAISAQTGLVKNANSTCLIGQALQQDIERQLNREVRVSNDANCMVVSEAKNGAALNYHNVFGVIIGTGTGGGLVSHEQLLSGANLIAGEWGHNPLPWQDENDLPDIQCYCGKKNCIETYLSGPGLLKRYQMLGGKLASVPELVKQRGNLSHPEADLIEIIWQNYEHQMAKSLAHVINIIDPDAIVLAGGLSNIKWLYQNIPTIWNRYVFSDTVTTSLLPAKHGDSSGVLGAAWLW